MSDNFSFGGDASVAHTHIDTRTSSKWVTNVAISGDTVILGYDDDIGLVQIDLANKAIVGRYEREIKNSVSGITFLPDSSIILVACVDGRLLTIDTDVKAMLNSVHHNKMSWTRAILLNAKTCVLIDDDGLVYTVDTDTLQITHIGSGTGFVDCHAIDEERCLLWCGGRTPEIGMYDFRSGRLLELNRFSVNSESADAFTGLHWCARRQKLFTMSEDGHIAIWNTSTSGDMNLEFEMEFEDRCYFMKSNDNAIAFSTSKSGVVVLFKDAFAQGKPKGIRIEAAGCESLAELSETHVFYTDTESQKVCCKPLFAAGGVTNPVELFNSGHMDFTALTWCGFGLVACANTDDVWLVSRDAIA